MRYVFHRTDGPIIERVCQISRISPDELDVGDFQPDHQMKILQDFKEKLLSYRDKRFFIVGDYDCDGICATTIMKKLFDDLGIASNHYIPSRIREGYGLNERIVKIAAENDFDVLLCVDNGIAANGELALAKTLGLKTFVIDHHEYEEVPDTDFLHPSLFPEGYEDMCAAGLCALFSNSIRRDRLSTVYGGIATLADMVKVFGYNRYLTKNAVQILNEETIYPIAYLAKNKECDYTALSYDVIPKINAVSRMDDMLNVNYVVRYLLDNSSDCMAYLNKIEEINTLRKDLTKQMSALAQRIIDPERKIIIVSSSAFREGLCGLIANRLMNEYGKPVIVLAESDGILKGSGRAVRGSDLYAYLSQRKDLFLTFGGHAQAVGLSMEKKDLDELQRYIDENPFEYEEYEKDVLVLDPDKIDMDLLDELKSLEPFGTGFEEPLFALEDISYKQKFLVASRYPKFILNDRLEAISFHPAHQNRAFETMLGHLKKDDYHKGKISFVIEDLI